MYVALLVCSKRVKSYNGSGTVARTRHTDWHPTDRHTRTVPYVTFSRPHDLIRAALRLPPRPPLVLVVCATTGVLKLHCRLQSHILRVAPRCTAAHYLVTS